MLARLVRDGFVESVHRGHMAVTGSDGVVLAAVGDPATELYPRSALKPVQVVAVLELLSEAGACPGSEAGAGLGSEAGACLDTAGIAVACASHSGSAEHQVEAARLLALAGLDERALQCPPALPADLAALRAGTVPDRLSHNCSGKHAAFLLGQVVAAQAPARYRDPASAVQRRVARAIAEHTGAPPVGPGVDGCGAPAWRIPLAALATGFARLAAHGPAAPPGPGARVAGQDPPGPGARVAGAMRARPDLVGAADAPDTRLMLADGRVVAKRGAEGVFAAGIRGRDGALGVAVKVADGGARAAAPVAATVLSHLGSPVPEDVPAPPVLGGERVHGRLEVAPAVARAASAAAPADP